jgi:hypothetical protein
MRVQRRGAEIAEISAEKTKNTGGAQRVRREKESELRSDWQAEAYPTKAGYRRENQEQGVRKAERRALRTRLWMVAIHGRLEKECAS